MGNFLRGVERVRRFMNVHLHCTVSNLKGISNMSTLPHLEKFLLISAEIYSGNPPDKFMRLFTSLKQIHSYATRNATQGAFFWQAVIKQMWKKIFKTLRHPGPKIWDYIDLSLHELSSFTFKKRSRDFLIAAFWVWENSVQASHCTFFLSPLSAVNLIFSSCTCPRDFHTWTLFSLWFVFLCCCWCSFVLQEQCVRLCWSFLVVDEVRTRDLQNTWLQELPASPF